MFEVGQKVKCVEGTWGDGLETGKIYTIAECGTDGFGAYIKVDGVPNRWCSSRFEAYVEPYVPTFQMGQKVKRVNSTWEDGFVHEGGVYTVMSSKMMSGTEVIYVQGGSSNWNADRFVPFEPKFQPGDKVQNIPSGMVFEVATCSETHVVLAEHEDSGEFNIQYYKLYVEPVAEVTPKFTKEQLVVALSNYDWVIKDRLEPTMN